MIHWTKADLLKLQGNMLQDIQQRLTTTIEISMRSEHYSRVEFYRVNKNSAVLTGSRWHSIPTIEAWHKRLCADLYPPDIEIETGKMYQTRRGYIVEITGVVKIKPLLFRGHLYDEDGEIDDFGVWSLGGFTLPIHGQYEPIDDNDLVSLYVSRETIGD